jgi:FkbM family methyltransferase
MKGTEASPMQVALSKSGARLVGGKLRLPTQIRRLKIDVGLSRDAVQSMRWLTEDQELAVIGFEPVPSNVSAVRTLIENSDPALRLAERLIVLELALSTHEGTLPMYVTDEDPGRSSLFIPKEFPVATETSVPVARLDSLVPFLDLDRFPRVDFLKTDCQGSDLLVLQGAGALLERVAIVTTEAENETYVGTRNSEALIQQFMISQGFSQQNARNALLRFAGKVLKPFDFVQRIYSSIRSKSRDALERSSIGIVTDDPTFVNQRFASEIDSGLITAYQRG